MRRIAALAALRYASMLVLAACGGSDDGAGAGDTPDAAAGTTQATAAPPATNEVPAAPAVDDAQDDVPEQALDAAEGTVTGDPAVDARRAQDGDSVSVHYRGTLDDGEVFDSSRERGTPLPFVLGSGQLISGFDDAVRGLAVGETITVRLTPDRAYGEVDPARVLEFPRDQAPPDLQVGDQVQLSSGAGATVVELTDDTVTIDTNHQLAGKTLTFEIELISIE